MEPEGKEGDGAVSREGASSRRPRAVGADDGSLREREHRSGYLGFVAHEVRTPLSTALWSAELLGRVPPVERGGARGEKLAATCRRALERLGHLVEDHLLVERLDAGGLPAHPEAVPVEELMAAAAKRAGLGTWRSDVGPDLVVLADRAMGEKALEGTLAGAARGGVAVQVGGGFLGGRVVLRVVGAEPPPRALEDPRSGSAPSDPARPLALPMARRAALAAGGRLAVEGGAYLLDFPAAYGPDAGSPPA